MCNTKLLILLLPCNLLLNAIKLTNWLIKLFMSVFFIWFSSWLLKKYEIKLFSKILFLLNYSLERYDSKNVIKLLKLFYLHENLSRIDLLQKVIKKLKDDIFSNDNIIFVNEDSNHVTFFGGEMSILSVDLDKINLDMLIMMKMILKLLFMSDLWLGLININNANHVKRYKQRIKVSEYP